MLMKVSIMMIKDGLPLSSKQLNDKFMKNYQLLIYLLGYDDDDTNSKYDDDKEVINNIITSNDTNIITFSKKILNLNNGRL